MRDRLTARQFHEEAGVEDWRVIGDGACTYFRTGSFAAGARLVQAISELGGLGDHQPDVDLRHAGVTVRLITITDDYYGMSEHDVELARTVADRLAILMDGRFAAVGRADEVMASGEPAVQAFLAGEAR